MREYYPRWSGNLLTEVSQWGCGFTSPRQGRKLSKGFISAKIIQRIPPTFANIGFNKIIPLLSAPLPQGAVRTSFQTLRRPTLHAGWWIMPLQMSVMQAEHLSSPADAASGDKVSLRKCHGWLQPRGLLKKLVSNQWYSYLKCWKDISEWIINWLNLLGIKQWWIIFYFFLLRDINTAEICN